MFRIISSDIKETMRQAVEAWLDGKTAVLAEIQNREILAKARRKLWRVIDGGKGGE